MKKVLKVFGIIILIFVLIIVCFSLFLNHGKDEVLNTKINDIDVSKVEDGTYIGKFDGYRWSNTVKVTVDNHKITKISFVEGQQFRSEEVENGIINNVISKQSLNVDTVAGGTVSSKAILKAIENAFK